MKLAIILMLIQLPFLGIDLGLHKYGFAAGQAAGIVLIFVFWKLGRRAGKQRRKR